MGASSLALLTVGVVILSKRHSLARSFTRIGHPRWSWVALGIVLEALSMTTFALMQSRLLRVGGKRVRTRPMMATILAANSVSGSVPVAGPELGAALTFRRFREQGADPTLASWALVVGGFVSWIGALVVLTAGGALTGNFKLVGVAILVGLFIGAFGIALRFGLRDIRVRHFLTSLASSVMRPLARLRSKPVRDPVAAAARWIGSIRSLRPTKADWNTIGALSIGNWLTDVGVLAMSILALGGPVPWRSLLLIYTLAILVGSLGLTPGGLGLVEGTLCVGLVSAGLPAALALGAVLLYRLVSFWLVMFAGWAVLLFLRLRRIPRQISLARSMAS
jgi:uncharacterized protein (TIRG00374 family)